MLFNWCIEVSLWKRLVIMMVRGSYNGGNILNKKWVIIFSDVELVQEDMDTIEYSSVIRKVCDWDKD